MRKRPYVKSVERLISKPVADKYLQEEVFGTSEFKSHAERTADILDIDPQIVRDVLESYWSNIFYLLNTVQKVNLKINVYGFFSFVYLKGKNLYVKKQKL
jgi:hypothetical protein